MLVDIIAGARPNFMKIAPIIHEIEKRTLDSKTLSYRLIHTGQHYDRRMSEDFFEQLNIPHPHYNLGSGSGTQAEQTSKIMTRYEALLMKSPCDLTLVVGDVTSTMACSIAAKKLNIKVAHVEAGIRSFDLSMPEEINRMVTDSITDFFFTTTPLAGQNLLNSGVSSSRIYFVGNVMIDTLYENLAKLRKPNIWDELRLEAHQFLLMTLHRPNNVDHEDKLKSLINEIVNNSNNLPIVFPIHPRTAKVFEKVGITHPNLHLLNPLGYLEFNYLVQRAKAVITDSGGITEETTVLGIPCMTLRDNTERPETCEIGTNELLGTQIENISPAMKRLFQGEWKKGEIPKFWDGKTAGRIVDVLLTL